jgi:hypothetical protein
VPLTLPLPLEQVAVGPLGRNAEGSGTVSTKGKTAALYSYSKTKGLFGGISVEGSIIVERQDANRMAYAQDVSSKELLSGALDRPEWSDELVEALKRCTGMPGGREWVDDSMWDREGDANGLGEEGENDDHDEYGIPTKTSSSSRKRAGTLPRSSSYGGYAFGEGGVGSFSNAAASPGIKGNRSRSGSGSLKGIFKSDGVPGVSNGIGFPRRISGSPMNSPGLKKGSSLNPFSSSRNGAASSSASGSNPFDDDVAETHANEVDPFDQYAQVLGGNRTRSGSGISKDMDLSGEVLSPWNNDKGLPSPKPAYENKSLPTSEEISSAFSRSRSSSNAATPFGNDTGSSGRSRAGSTAAKFQSPLRDDFSPGNEYRSNGHYDDTRDLTAKMGRLRASTVSGKLSKRDTDGYSREYGDDGEDVYHGSTPGKEKKDWTVDVSLPKSSSGFFSKAKRNRANTGGSDFLVDPNQWRRQGEISGSTPPAGDRDAYFSNVDDDFIADKPGRPKMASRPTFTIRKELVEAEKDGLPRAIALFDYDPAESGDLGFDKGEILIVTKQGRSKEEWCVSRSEFNGDIAHTDMNCRWTGRNPSTGKEGIFP